MDTTDILELALNSLRHRKLRSWLAILGIVIGVASVISLISISVGLNENIKSSMGGLGADVITISSGGARADSTGPAGFGGGGPPGGNTFSNNGIKFTEAEALRKIKGVAAVDARVSGNAPAHYRDMNATLQVIGVDSSAFPNSSSATIAEGRTIGPSGTFEVVLGASVQTDTFNDSMLNKPITIDGTTFRVVGVLNASGSTFNGPDNSVFIPQKTAKELFNQTTYASSIVVLAASGYDPDAVASNITAALRQMHHVTATTQDFTVTTATSLQSTISSVSSSLALFLGAIAGISLIIGGIGVANAMFTSVLEQTKFIGLLKSLGGRDTVVMELFIFESSMVGFAGGVVGVLLSFVGSELLSVFGLPSKITLELVLLGLGFSLIIGIVSGLIPARNASKIEPVEALRYE